MDQWMIFLHIAVGLISLISGAISIIAPKRRGGSHVLAGKVFFWSMSLIFFTGILLATVRINQFLFFIAFFSYYAVISGIRILKLKKLHRNQTATKKDWMLHGGHFVIQCAFIIFALYLVFAKANLSGGLLSISFGLGGVALTWVNVSHFFKKPTFPRYWYTAHLGNMLGAYLSTLTAALLTINSRFDWIDPKLMFLLPVIIGLPIITGWIRKIELDYRKGINRS
jgi:hypothetical protein